MLKNSFIKYTLYLQACMTNLSRHEALRCHVLHFASYKLYFQHPRPTF